MADNEKRKKKGGDGRSPAFPFIPLDKALVRCQELLDAENRNWVPLSSAINAWKYGEKSSGGRLTASALRYFGLIEDKGAKSDRKLRVSNLGWEILKTFDENDPGRLNLIKTAALTPKIHGSLWGEYEDHLPSETTLLTHLVRDKGFNESGANALIKEYKDTINFAKLTKSDKLSGNAEENDYTGSDNGQSGETPPPRPKKGTERRKVHENITFERSWDLVGGITATLEITGIPPKEEKEFLELCISRAVRELFAKNSLAKVDDSDDENQE